MEVKVRKAWPPRRRKYRLVLCVCASVLNFDCLKPNPLSMKISIEMWQLSNPIEFQAIFNDEVLLT